MDNQPLTQLHAAHEQVVALIRTIPDAALDWQPDSDSWSPKRIVAHIAHAYEFYLMIVEQARATGFGTAKLNPELASWQRVEATDAAALACPDVPALLECLAATAAPAISVFAAIAPDELDRPFMLASWRPDADPETTTLRRRVLGMATDHLREHHAQIAATLGQWRASNPHQ